MRPTLIRREARSGADAPPKTHICVASPACESSNRRADWPGKGRDVVLAEGSVDLLGLAQEKFPGKEWGAERGGGGGVRCRAGEGGGVRTYARMAATRAGA
jgi:hypothetical protein